MWRRLLFAIRLSCSLPFTTSPGVVFGYKSSQNDRLRHCCGSEQGPCNHKARAGAEAIPQEGSEYPNIAFSCFLSLLGMQRQQQQQ